MHEYSEEGFAQSMPVEVMLEMQRRVLERSGRLQTRDQDTFVRELAEDVQIVEAHDKRYNRPDVVALRHFDGYLDGAIDDPIVRGVFSTVFHQKREPEKIVAQLKVIVSALADDTMKSDMNVDDDYEALTSLVSELRWVADDTVVTQEHEIAKLARSWSNRWKGDDGALYVRCLDVTSVVSSSSSPPSSSSMSLSSL